VVRAVVRYLHSPDLELGTEAPPDPEDFEILVQVMAGPADGPGEESFDVVVCTPACLRRAVRKGPVLGRHLLVVDRYDLDVIERFLVTAVEAARARSWPELGTLIGRIGKWEFEGQ
jgi:hypothetical protein